MPVFAGDGRRITIDLPLPLAALDRDDGLTPANDETLARLAPETTSHTALTPPPAGIRAVPAVEQSPPIHLQQLDLRLADGQSLYLLFKRNRLSQADLSNMLSSSRQARRLLSRLHPGQKITLWVSAQNRVEKLILKTPGPTDVLLNRSSSGYWFGKQPDSEPQLTPQQRPTTRDQASATAKDVTQSAELAARELRAEVKSGDSLYLIFKRNHIPAGDLAQLMSAKGSKALKRLHPGQWLDLRLGSGNALLALQMQVDETRTLHALRTTKGFSLTTRTQPLERRITTANATIENSLFLAGQRAGLSDQVIMRLVEIFGWDIDFALDIRAGDRFTLIYEELYREGSKLRDGQILAADFFNRGRSIRALRYTEASGRSAYYSPKGLSMRKAFLRTPVSYTRISSRFNKRRKHPVLNRIRAHRGVDYSAPRGTPIKAAGDGRVILAGRKGGYGKTVILRHGGKYSTLYGHMSRLHKRARRGKQVYQGQIIGYVGSTGLATGPHLHYEFRVRGVHQDPLRVKLPKALPIDRRYKADFLAKSKPLVAHLDSLATTSIASTP